MNRRGFFGTLAAALGLAKALPKLCQTIDPMTAAVNATHALWPERTGYYTLRRGNAVTWTAPERYTITGASVLNSGPRLTITGIDLENKDGRDVDSGPESEILRGTDGY